MAYINSIVIIETPIFTKQILSAFSEEEYRLFQAALLERPDAGKVIPGSAGLRKLRWAIEGRGKRGGVSDLLLVHVKGNNSAPVHVSEECAGQPDPGPTQTTQEDH